MAKLQAYYVEDHTAKVFIKDFRKLSTEVLTAELINQLLVGRVHFSNAEDRKEHIQSNVRVTLDGPCYDYDAAEEETGIDSNQLIDYDEQDAVVAISEAFMDGVDLLSKEGLKYHEGGCHYDSTYSVSYYFTVDNPLDLKSRYEKFLEEIKEEYDNDELVLTLLKRVSCTLQEELIQHQVEYVKSAQKHGVDEIKDFEMTMLAG